MPLRLGAVVVGLTVDQRTDIWAFGCVLYEMLTGRAAFLGEDVASTLARVLESNPDWSALPARVRPEVRRTLDLCLRKDARSRLRAIGDARLALDGELTTSTSRRAPLWQRALPAATTLVIGAALASELAAVCGCGLRYVSACDDWSG